MKSGICPAVRTGSPLRGGFLKLLAMRVVDYSAVGIESSMFSGDRQGMQVPRVVFRGRAGGVGGKRLHGATAVEIEPATYPFDKAAGKSRKPESGGQ